MTPSTTRHVRTWAEAEAAVREIAAENGIPLVLWGVGNFVGKPHVQAVCEWNVCNITVRPEGDGYLAPHTFYTIHVSR